MGDPDSPVTVLVSTDVASSVVLHWGVKRPGGGDWLRPDAALLPEGTDLLEGGIAVETAFTPCTNAECDVSIGGAKVPLQRVTLQLPSGHGLNGLAFVVRSEDGEGERRGRGGGRGEGRGRPAPLLSSPRESKHAGAGWMASEESLPLLRPPADPLPS